MALIKCRICGKEISDTTKKCIHCGASFKEKKAILKNKKIIVFILVLLIIISIITIIIFRFIRFGNKNIVINNNENKNIVIEENDNDNSNDNNENKNIVIEENDNDNSNDNNDDTNKHISNNKDEIQPDKNNKNLKVENSNTVSNNDTKRNINNNNNKNESKKVIIDAVESKKCPEGYEFKSGFEYTDSACLKMNIINGSISYYCSIDSHVLEGDKCKWVYKSKPLGGQCYGDAVLNNDVCEEINYVSASTRLNCPSGYTKYDDTRCYKFLNQKAIITYSCPDGYKLNGNKCEK